MISAWRAVASKDSFNQFDSCEFEVIERSKLLDSLAAEGQDDASSRSRRSRTDENRQRCGNMCLTVYGGISTGSRLGTFRGAVGIQQTRVRSVKSEEKCRYVITGKQKLLHLAIVGSLSCIFILKIESENGYVSPLQNFRWRLASGGYSGSLLTRMERVALALAVLKYFHCFSLKYQVEQNFLVFFNKFAMFFRIITQRVGGLILMNGGVCLLWTAEQFEGISFYRNHPTFSASEVFFKLDDGRGSKAKGDWS